MVSTTSTSVNQLRFMNGKLPNPDDPMFRCWTHCEGLKRRSAQVKFCEGISPVANQAATATSDRKQGRSLACD